MAYSVKSAGVAMKKIALSYSLYNVFDLISKTALTVLNPLFASLLEKSLQKHSTELFYVCIALYMFTWLIGSLLSIVYLPAFHNFFKMYVCTYEENPRAATLLKGLVSKISLKLFFRIIKKVSLKNATLSLFKKNVVPRKVYWLSTLSHALTSISIPACLLAAAMAPDYRMTSLTLAPLISGWATLMLFLFIDPYIAMESEKVVKNQTGIKRLRLELAHLAFTKVLGTFLGILLLLPVAYLIELVAKALSH